MVTSDIYLEMDLKVLLQNFWYLSIEDKKKLIDKELKNYILCKIESIDVKLIGKLDDKELSAPELLGILADIIPVDQKFEILRHFTHYVIALVGNLQNWSVIWWVEEDEELINSQVLEIEDETWKELKTHKDTDYVKTFSFVYDMFMSSFMVKNSDKKFVKKINQAWEKGLVIVLFIVFYKVQ